MTRGPGMTPGDPTDPLAPGVAPGAAPRRAASATLRDGAAAREGTASLDPAQRSLAEALRISFFLLQVGMLVLIGLFLVSGAQQVRESERGIRLTFGRVSEQDVAPGLHFSWPFPVGEFLTVQTGLVSQDLDAEFWPRMTETQKKQALDTLTQLTGIGLAPATDGSLITGDNNLVHAQWRVEYHRESPTDFVRNVHTPDEPRLVRAAVQRGVVRAVAEMPIEELLKQGGAGAAVVAPPADATTPPTGAEGQPPATGAAQPATTPESTPAGTPATPPAPTGAPGAPAAAPARTSSASGESALAARVRRIAQETLDAVGAGIRIDQCVLKQLTPPLPVRPSFQQVQAAQSQAEKAREDAEKDRRTELNKVAGLAHPFILDRIDAYERAIETNDDAAATGALTQINSLVEGEPVEIGGERLERLASGEVTDIINAARRYRTEVVSSSRSDVESFRAKLEQYRVSPAVLLNREWTDAFLEMLAGPTVQVMLVPPDASLELWLNSDPEYLKAQERERNKQQIQATITQRERDFGEARKEMNRVNPNPKPRQ